MEEENPLSFAEIGQPTHGNITQKDDVLEYTPEADYVGIDSLWYTITDGKKASKKAYIVIKVMENLAPNTQRDVFNIFPWNAVSLPVMNNDADREGDSI